MRYALDLRPEAQSEIDEAADWYHRDSARAADAFLDAVDDALARVRENPFQFPVRSGPVRYAIVTGFPYSLLFQVGGTQIVVTTCIHFRRDPGHWR